MCCEQCPKYDRCADDNSLKDESCPKCPEYYGCAGMDDRKKGSYQNGSYDDYQ